MGFCIMEDIMFGSIFIPPMPVGPPPAAMFGMPIPGNPPIPPIPPMPPIPPIPPMPPMPPIPPSPAIGSAPVPVDAPVVEAPVVDAPVPVAEALVVALAGCADAVAEDAA